MNDEQRRQDLAEFLRTRRVRLTPEQVGLFRGTRRRTPGLRREEVAQLAHVGVSWYTLLEQGRAVHPSREVLQSIADALQLTPAERHHLFVLADQTPLALVPAAEAQVSPVLRRLLDALNPNPAYIMGRRWNCLAWNTAAEQILQLESTQAYGHNMMWRMFVDPASRACFYGPQWEQAAHKVLEEFRADTVLATNEPWFKQLIADLQRSSPEFRAWWPRHDVRGWADARKEMYHPQVGYLAFDYTRLHIPTIPDLKVIVHTPVPETDTMAKLQQLQQQSLPVAEPALLP